MGNGKKNWAKVALLFCIGLLVGWYLLQNFGGGGGSVDPSGNGSGSGDNGGSVIVDPTPNPGPSPDPTPSPDPGVDPSTFKDKSVGGTLSGTFAYDGTVGVWEDAWYDTAPEVALYIHTFGWLPGNYITKDEARTLGWSGGTLRTIAPGKSIGGDVFGNSEKKLPRAKGRTWYEADIQTTNKKARGEKRILFSSDGLIYYTSDHYETYTQLY